MILFQLVKTLLSVAAFGDGHIEFKERVFDDRSGELAVVDEQNPGVRLGLQLYLPVFLRSVFIRY